MAIQIRNQNKIKIEWNGQWNNDGIKIKVDTSNIYIYKNKHRIKINVK